MKAYIRNMRNQTGERGPHEIAYCPKCGAEFSANKSDYWQLKDSDALRCMECKRILILVTKQTRYAEYK